MTKILPLGFLLISLFFSTTGVSQNLIDNKGTEFWLMFNENLSAGDLKLFIASEVATTANIEALGTNFSESISIEPGMITTVDLPSSAMVTVDNGIADKGIHITASTEIAVYGLNQVSNTSDAYMALPVDALGMEYIVMAFQGQGGSQYGIVATEDNTEITVNSPGVSPINFMLNKGQAYQGLASGNQDFTGTQINANKPIAVFGGNKCAFVPPSARYCDHLVEQMPPISSWGMQFLTVPLATRRNGEVFRILASNDNTSIAINDTEVAVINKGEFYETTLTEISEIQTNKAVLVAQFSTGTTFDNVTSDPFMVLVPPFEQFGSSTTIATPTSNIFSAHYLNLVVDNRDLNSVRLDGNQVANSEFIQVGQTNFSVASVAVNPGSHSVSANLPLGVYVYGFGDFDSYGYLGGQIFSGVAEVRSISLSLANDTIPTGSEGCLMAGVSDADNNPRADIRLDISITGANPQNTFEFTDQNGQIELCYDAVNEGVDNITVSLGIDNLSQTTIRTVGCYDTNNNGVNDCEEIMMPTPPDCPILQKDINDACDDGDSNTENDKVTNECECIGTPKDTPPPPPTTCQGTITPMPNGFELKNFSLKHNKIIVYDLNFSTTFAEINYETNFRGDTMITDLPKGDYAIKIQIYNENWQANCDEVIYLSITESATNEPPSNNLCEGVSVSGAYGTMTVGGLENGPKEVAVLAENGYVIFSCSHYCGAFQQYEGLDAGNYTVRVTFYDTNWQLICQRLIPYSLENGAGSRDNGKILSEDLSVAPNPANDFTEIDLFPLKDLAVEIALTDFYGRVLWQKEIPKVEQSFEKIDTRAFPNGLYFLQIKTSNRPRISKKLMISRLY